MTTPPPEPPEGGPPGYPYGPNDPYDPYNPPPRRRYPASTVVGLAFVGAFIYFAINLVVIVAAVLFSLDSRTSTTVLAGAAVALAVIAFGGGGALLAIPRAWAKGMGLGLMIGWALTSIFTFGMCTGINPQVYG